MASNPKTFLTPEQYLELEHKAEIRSEYFQGEVFAISGAQVSHNRIVTNLVGMLYQHFRRRPCHVYSHDMRVRVNATGLYTYPDVLVVCGEEQIQHAETDTLLNPTFIAEVLSPSTEAYDRGKKFDHYKPIESLREYLLVASDRVHADLFTRQPDGRWMLTSADGMESSLGIESIDCQIAIADVYEKVDL
jgi:Uma2 family endonuclease